MCALSYTSNLRSNNSLHGSRHVFELGNNVVALQRITRERDNITPLNYCSVFVIYTNNNNNLITAEYGV